MLDISSLSIKITKRDFLVLTFDKICSIIIASNIYFGGIFMAKNNELGMKWFKFLINFLLWANAAIYLFEGMAMLSLSKGVVDTIYGITSIVFALFCIFTRFRLAKFKKGAPSNLYALYILESIVLVLVYNIASCMVAGTFNEIPVMILTPDFISSVVGTFVVVALNKTYFDKRKHLFVN